MNRKTSFVTALAVLLFNIAPAQTLYHFLEPDQLNGKVFKVISITHWDVNHPLTNRDILYNDTAYYDGKSFANEYYRWAGGFGHKDLFKALFKVNTADGKVIIQRDEVVRNDQETIYLNMSGLPDSIISHPPTGYIFRDFFDWNEAKRELVLRRYNGSRFVAREVYTFNKKHLIDTYTMSGAFNISFKYTYKDFDKYGNWTKRIAERHQQVAFGPDVTTEITERQIIYAN